MKKERKSEVAGERTDEGTKALILSLDKGKTRPGVPSGECLVPASFAWPLAQLEERAAIYQGKVETGEGKAPRVRMAEGRTE